MMSQAAGSKIKSLVAAEITLGWYAGETRLPGPVDRHVLKTASSVAEHLDEISTPADRLIGIMANTVVVNKSHDLGQTSAAANRIVDATESFITDYRTTPAGGVLQCLQASEALDVYTTANSALRSRLRDTSAFVEDQGGEVFTDHMSTFRRAQRQTTALNGL